MKKVSFSVLILGCILSFKGFSLDLELIGGLGNLAFDQDLSSALSYQGKAFDPELFPLVLARFSGEYMDLHYNAGFERGPLVRNRLFVNLKLERDYFSIELGPFMGLFNSLSPLLNPGLSAGLSGGVPGIVFARINGSSTLGGITDIPGSYSQSTADISAGFWAPYAICSLNMSIRNFTFRQQNRLIEDELTRYFFSTDVYTKNVPFTIKIDLGYQSLTRSYNSKEVSGTKIVNKSETDAYKSVFIGLEGTYTFSPKLKFLLGGEMPVFSWGERPMKDPSKSTLLFQARAGVIWTIAE